MARVGVGDRSSGQGTGLGVGRGWCVRCISRYEAEWNHLRDRSERRGEAGDTQFWDEEERVEETEKQPSLRKGKSQERSEPREGSVSRSQEWSAVLCAAKTSETDPWLWEDGLAGDFFFFLRAAGAAYRGSQARSWIGAAEPVYTTATPRSDLSCVCDLYHSSQQRWILKPLREATDWTRIFMDTSQVRYHQAVTGTSLAGDLDEKCFVGVFRTMPDRIGGKTFYFIERN